MKIYGIVSLMVLVSAAGCAPREIFRLFGVGARQFKTRGKCYSRQFALDLEVCYIRAKKAFGEIGAKVARGRLEGGFMVVSRLNGVFRQCSASTEVALFFSSYGGKTMVEVCSLNYYLSEFIAGFLFDRLALLEEDLR